MIIRLQVKGFKNLYDVDVSFGPFTCIAGTNGVGKSNLFDAIKFLSYLSDKTPVEAAFSIRENQNEKRSADDIRSIFYHDGINFIGKIEGGYLLNRSMHDGVLDQDMVFVSESSRPFYYKMDINVRFLRHFTVGFSACQSGNLLFRRFAGQKSETTDSWRINAFTLQLGIALDAIR